MDILLRHKFLVLAIIIELITLPILLFALRQKQQQITSAQRSTVVFFNPPTSSTSPLSKNIGDNFSLDLMIRPANNLISLAKLEITYDPTKITLDSTSSAVINSEVFPVITEGPIISDGKIMVVLSVGKDLTKIIQKESKALTLNFKAISPITKTQISFGPETGLYSVAKQDSNTENILSSAMPATIEVKNTLSKNVSITPITFPSQTPTRFQSPTPTSRQMPSPSPLPTPIISLDPNSSSQSGTILNIKGLKLHGIGIGGDNSSTLSAGNPDPIRTTRVINVEVYDSSEKLLTTIKGTVVYDNNRGDFSGTMNIPSALPNGNYIFKIKISQYLKKQLPGLINVVQGKTITPPSVSLITGDVNDDNKLNSDDYNLIIDCYSDFAVAKNCDTSKKLSADINDDGSVNHLDYNLYLREISVISGE